MPLLSAFTPCGFLEMSGDNSHAEDFYDELQRLYGPGIDFTPGTYAEAKLYAMAMGLAGCLYELEHAGNQAHPRRAYDLLPLLESDFDLVPGLNDTIPTRQAAVAAAELLSRGARAENIVNGLKAIFGTAFLSYTTATPISGGAFQPTVYPSSPGAGPGNFADVRVPMRALKLVDPVTLIGGIGQWCAYQNLDPSESAVTLNPGDVVVVQGENTAQMDRVTVSATALTPPANSFASPATLPAGTTCWAPSTTYAAGAHVQPTSANDVGVYFLTTAGGVSGTVEPIWPSTIGQSVSDSTVSWVATGAGFCFHATFGKAHDVGASVIAGNFPYWWSTQRYNLIVVTAAAAINPDLRRKANNFLAKALRGVSPWAIVAAATTTATGGTTGPLTVNTPMGTATIGALTFVTSH